MPGFSNIIVYVDESGDHSLESIDPQFPVFTLAFCLFEKGAYASSVAPAIQNFKFEHFGHDAVILHEREIRKQLGPFAFLANRERRSAFLARLSDVIAEAPFTLIAVAIDKHRLADRYKDPGNPYALALRFGLERIHHHLAALGQADALTHIVVESRGRKEDDQLQLEFLKVCSGDNFKGIRLPFALVFASKQTNSSGLQLADLVARPISRHVLNPEQENRAFQLLESKFYRSESGVVPGFGLKVFP